MPLQAGLSLGLPPAAARHVQVLRMQPGQGLTLFDGRGGEYDATVRQMSRTEVVVDVGPHHAVEREAPRAIHLAVGMPANERMDWLVEKAAELGAASVQPLLTERSVLRPSGDRAEKKQSHWQAVAVAACEQCGRNRVPAIHPVRTLAEWLALPHDVPGAVLSLRGGSAPLSAFSAPAALRLLSGPEGGLSPVEEEAALASGLAPLSLGARVLRAETAPLAALVLLTEAA